MANKYLALVNNVLREVVALVASAGAGDAGKIVALGADGRLDQSVMPVGIGADTKNVLASEALSAGDYVNIYDNAGTANCRKASAADATKQANGYVLNNVASGALAMIYFKGANNALTGLTAGIVYVLSAATPGAVVAQSAAPAADGNILQVIGTATAANEINTEIDQPVIRAV